MKDGKYSIELLREGEGHDIEIVLAREDNLDRARVLARSDLLETAPSFS
jgi:hypothetical protein